MIEGTLSKKDQDFLAKVQRINQELSEKSALVDVDLLDCFAEHVQALQESIAEAKQTSRLLRIGVVGCVKAGKSSFLNALLFDGQPILPKAATPMTASLTKLSYGEKTTASVHFFEEQDWDTIQRNEKHYQEHVQRAFDQLDKEYQAMLQSMQGSGGYYAPQPPTWEYAEKRAATSETQRAAHEIVTMVEQQKLSVSKYLGQSKDLQADDYKTLLENLESYVGAQGKWTPLVNYIELQIKHPLLKDLEVIDTPGLNDPVVSRSVQTMKYLEKCDVVLVLSSVSQFLTNQEMNLLSKKLGEITVERVYLLGTQLDSGILQYPNRNKTVTFVEAYNKSIANYNAQVQNVFKTLSANDPSPLVQRLCHSEPLYVSSMALNIAKKMETGAPIVADSEENHIIESMKKRFCDYTEMMSDANSYMEFSGFSEIRKIYEEIRTEKAKILQDKAHNYNRQHASRLLKDLESILTAAKTNQEILSNENVESLQEKLNFLTRKLDSIRTEVANIFESQAANSHRFIQDIKLEISKTLPQHTELQVDTRREQRTTQESYGFLGLMKRQNTYTEEIKVARSSEAVENVQEFGTKALELLNQNLKKAFDTESLKNQIKQCVISVFELSGREFNPNEILLPLSTLLDTLTVAAIDFDFFTDAQKEIYNAFNSTEGVVEGNRIHKLYQVQQEQLTSILQLCSQKLDETDENIQLQMERNAGLFVDNIQKKVAGNIELTKKLLADQEGNIRQYEEFIGKLQTDYKKVLANFQ